MLKNPVNCLCIVQLGEISILCQPCLSTMGLKDIEDDKDLYLPDAENLMSSVETRQKYNINFIVLFKYLQLRIFFRSSHNNNYSPQLSLKIVLSQSAISELYNLLQSNLNESSVSKQRAWK